MRRNLNASMQVGPYREETLNGRDYIVVNMTLIVPGVLDGSNGPLLYEEDELARDPDLWNGIPLIAYHPEIQNDDGEVVATSARDPHILAKSQVGYNYRTEYKDGALRSEGWFDKELTANYDANLPEEHRMLPRLLNGQPIELSTGLFAENLPSKGTHNGTPYHYVARNYKADHIAILPDQQGACSVKDGCGTSITTAEVKNCRYNYRGRCINCNRSRQDNCGGEHGKHGPCPKGDQGSVKGSDSDSGSGVDDKGTGHGDDIHTKIHEHLKKNPGATPSELRKLFAPKEKYKPHDPLSHSVHKALVKLRDTGKVKVSESQFGEPRFHANCGGKGGKPGPCPKGTSDKSGSTKASSSKSSSKTAQKPTKQKAFRNPAEANKLSSAADAASKAANVRQPQPSKKEGGIGQVPHEEASASYMKKQKDAEQAHDKAEKEHRKLASIRGPTSSRHASIADHHKDMASLYKKRQTTSYNTKNLSVINQGDTMKEKLIKWLTVNCDCWKGKEKILENFEEEDIKELKSQFIAKRVTNAAAAQFKGAFTTNAEGEGEVAGFDYATLAEFFSIEVDITKDPVGFIKALRGKLQEVMDALDHSEPAPEPPAAPAVNTDDEPALNAMDDVGPAKDPTQTSNKRKKLTPKEFTELMPDEYKDAWTDFVGNSRNERVKLLNHITNGASPEEKKTLLAAYKNMPLPQLRVVAKRMGIGTAQNNNRGGYLPEDNLPTFGGASGYNPNQDSTFDENDIFEVPVQNFSRKERFKPQKPNHLTSDDDDIDGMSGSGE